jgi:hypothetical protein
VTAVLDLLNDTIKPVFPLLVVGMVHLSGKATQDMFPVAVRMLDGLIDRRLTNGLTQATLDENTVVPPGVSISFAKRNGNRLPVRHGLASECWLADFG